MSENDSSNLIGRILTTGDTTMSFLKRTAGLVGGTILSLGTSLKVLSGGVSVKTADIPISSIVLDSLSLQDVKDQMKRNLTAPDEPVKVAVVRERHGQLWKVSFVILNQRNKRCSDSDGKLRAHAQLVRLVTPELEEFLGVHNSVLVSPLTQR